jgi:hypothetical protein
VVLIPLLLTLFFFIVSLTFILIANRTNYRANLARLSDYQQPAKYYKLARYTRFWKWVSRATLVVAIGCLFWWLSLIGQG